MQQAGQNAGLRRELKARVLANAATNAATVAGLIHRNSLVGDEMGSGYETDAGPQELETGHKRHRNT